MNVAARPRILSVEDSKFLRLTVERAMTRAGYDVTAASDGEEALAMAREGKPDLILLDLDAAQDHRPGCSEDPEG
jgi:CheY-like chemotaxis protein